jgi:hypothetical protein
VTAIERPIAASGTFDIGDLTIETTTREEISGGSCRSTAGPITREALQSRASLP